jgi:GTP-binding protein Era
MKSLKETKTPIIMALNKRDLGQYYADDYIENWRDKTNPIRKQKTASNGASNTESLKYFIPISALEKRNLDRLLDALFEFLPESDNLYPLDIVSDLPQKLLIADIIREKIFNQTQDEVPHSVAVKIDNIEEKENGVLYIQATILVERSSQKAIIIGAKGKFLKAIGTEARKELQSNYNRKVYLDLWVKIQKNWQNNPAVLKDLGYIV